MICTKKISSEVSHLLFMVFYQSDFNSYSYQVSPCIFLGFQRFTVSSVRLLIFMVLKPADPCLLSGIQERTLVRDRTDESLLEYSVDLLP